MAQPIRHPRFIASIRLAAVAALVSAIAGCYVVPMDPRTGQPLPAPVVPGPAAAPGPVSFPVRLYPANEQAGRYGIVNATVTNDLQGRGTFSTLINGESFVGEATRRPGATRSGIASGAGNRGSYVSCDYTMNSATQGTGQCRLSDGAVFTMHMGN